MNSTPDSGETSALLRLSMSPPSIASGCRHAASAFCIGGLEWIAHEGEMHSIADKICYRRAEAIKDARSLYERLAREFGEDRVFIDLDGIEPGEDFVAHLRQQLDACGALVVVIGPQWASGLPLAQRLRLRTLGGWHRPGARHQGVPSAYQRSNATAQG